MEPNKPEAFEQTKELQKAEERVYQAYPVDDPLRYSVDIRHTTHMTKETAAALAEVARLEHAVPARQESVRHALTVAVVAIVAIWFLVLLNEAVRSNSNLASTLVWAIVAIVAVLGAEPIVKALIKGAKGGFST